MMQSLLARIRLWEEALAGIDDPQGAHLLVLDERVRRLEAEVEQLRKPPPDATVAAATTRAQGIGRELTPPSNQRGIK